jgi:hypothetical protein
MRHQALKVITLLFVIFSFLSVFSQEAILVSGGDATGTGGTSSYSVGQVAYSTHTSSAGSVSEGVQQAYEISDVTGINHNVEINLSFSAYPNPTTDFLILKIGATESNSTLSMRYQLFDLNGKLIESQKITGKETTVSMNNLVSATYFLMVTVGNKEIKKFKILKR